MKKIITFISDTHSKHSMLKDDLIGGDILIHGGDFMTSGYSEYEALEFFKWFEAQDYEDCIFISGNHDRIMQNEPEKMRGILTGYKGIDYLEDEEMVLYGDGPNGEYPEENIRIYGSPWQPEFFNWAYNLPRNGEELSSKWEAIPENTDILITHGPAWGYLDATIYKPNQKLGCELLRERIDSLKPKIHIFGHIHSAHGYYFNGHTHFINASVLNEQYKYTNVPQSFEWDSITNQINWL